MANYKIPNQDGQVRQLNLNDTSGEIWASLNVDLHTEPRKIKLARPIRLIVPATDLDGPGDDESSTVQAISFADTGSGLKVYILTNETMYISSTDYDTYVADFSASINNALDTVVFDGKLIVTTTADLDYINLGAQTFQGSWWSGLSGPTLQTVTSGVSPYPFILENVRIGEETLVVTNGSTIESYTGAVSGGGTFVTVDIDDALYASCIKAGIDKVYIGTVAKTGEDAFVVRWDGASTNYDIAYPVGAKAVLAMELVDNVPLIVTERGDIKLFNGVGFTTIAQFPFSRNPVSVSDYFAVAHTQSFIHPKGIKAVGRNVYFNVKPSDGTTPIDERSPAGLWVLNIDTKSLTHLASINNESDSAVNSPILILPNEEDGRIFLAGQAGYDTTKSGLYREDLNNTTTYGYIVTSEIESDTVQDSFKEIIIKALLGASDKIVVKYRVSNEIDYPIIAEGATWLTTSTFNTTTDLSDVLTRFENGKSDEVEIIKGAGAGRLAHITNIESSGSVYSVTIDETIGVVGESLDARVDNWNKIPVEMTSADGEVKRFGIDAVGTWIQFKISMQGSVGIPEIREILIKTNAKETL